MFSYLGNKIERPGDLAPKGVSSTVGSRDYSMKDFNSTFKHLFRQIKKLK